MGGGKVAVIASLATSKTSVTRLPQLNSALQIYRLTDVYQVCRHNGH
jgi:hypothetical protein